MKYLILVLGLVLTNSVLSQDNKPTNEKAEAAVEEAAEYPGGYGEMMKFIAKHLVYPPEAVKANIEGKLNLRFIVEKNGKISTIKVVKAIPNCPQCSVNIIKVIKKMPKWKPGKVNGKVVRSYFDLPVSFRLN